jgi:proteasome lid subunit RPN8/RPN11
MKKAEISLGKREWQRLLTEALGAFPQEACGLLLGQGNCIEHVVPARNVHPTPRTHFEIDPQALVDAFRSARQGGPGVFGYYHSHPGGRPEPSATDRAMASGDGRVWAIVAGDDVAFWRDDTDGFAMLSYRVDDR